MLRALSGIIVLSLAFAPAAVAASAHTKRAADKHHVARHKHRYGFLPGYRPPELIERQRLARYWRSRPRYYYYGPAWPRFHHGRWNGGGFGPCYRQTPIGYVWTCGK